MCMRGFTFLRLGEMGTSSSRRRRTKKNMEKPDLKKRVPIYRNPLVIVQVMPLLLEHKMDHLISSCGVYIKHIHSVSECVAQTYLLI
jgi:hypothetical protein